MYAHNSSRYDNRLFIQYYDKLVKKGYKVAFKDINSRILVSISKDERTVRFLDSQLLLLSSLDKLSKAFNVTHKKLKVDYRNLSKKKLNFISVPSAFTKITGQKHWLELLKARAIENFCYIFAPNQTGKNTKNQKITKNI